MSRKKEKKIKRLKRVSVLPVIFKQILTEAAILAFSIIIGLLVILVAMQDSFRGMVTDCETVLSTVNENWSEKNNAPLLERLKNQEKDLPTVEKIFLIDSETNMPVAGLNEDDFDPRIITTRSPFFKNNAKSIYSSEDNVLVGINFGFGKGLDLRQFFKALSINALIDEESSNWASKEQSRINFYSLYRTDIPGLSVLICTPLIITTMHQHILGFLGVLVTFEFIVCIVIEFVTLFSLLAEKRRINHLFYTDPMTGGLNRSYFLQRGAKLIKGREKIMPWSTSGMKNTGTFAPPTESRRAKTFWKPLTIRCARCSEKGKSFPILRTQILLCCSAMETKTSLQKESTPCLRN